LQTDFHNVDSNTQAINTPITARKEIANISIRISEP